MSVPLLPLSSSVARRLCGRPFLLLLDVDGTLSPIAPRPEYAIVPDATRQAVLALTKLPFVEVAVISGRAASDARRIVGVDAAWVIGNHGIELAAPNEEPTAQAGVERYSEPMAAALERCARLAEREPGVLIEDKRWTFSVHYRLAHPRIVADLVADVTAVVEALGLRVTRGKEVLDVRPPIDIDKGTSAIDVSRRLGALADAASILCAGDDRTDEDAFVAIRAAHGSAVTVKVGSAEAQASTAAEFCVNDTDEMRDALEAIIALRGAGTS